MKTQKKTVNFSRCIRKLDYLQSLSAPSIKVNLLDTWTVSALSNPEQREVSWTKRAVHRIKNDSNTQALPPAALKQLLSIQEQLQQSVDHAACVTHSETHSTGSKPSNPNASAITFLDRNMAGVTILTYSVMLAQCQRCHFEGCLIVLHNIESYV